jgi:hypothetical protein
LSDKCGLQETRRDPVAGVSYNVDLTLFMREFSALLSLFPCCTFTLSWRMIFFNIDGGSRLSERRG